jgi:hypothetical protein
LNGFFYIGNDLSIRDFIKFYGDLSSKSSDALLEKSFKGGFFEEGVFDSLNVSFFEPFDR